MQYDQQHPQANGTLKVKGLQSKSLELANLDAEATFHDWVADAVIHSIKLPGVEALVRSEVDLSRFPLQLKHFQLTGQQFIVSLYSEWVIRSLAEKFANKFGNRFSRKRVSSMIYRLKSRWLDFDERGYPQ